MTIVRSTLQHGVSLNRALKLCGIAKKRWYYEPKQREMVIDLDMLQMIREIRDERPFYGTRRVAAEMSRRLDRVVNRKTVRRIYRRMGWDEPQRMRVPKIRWTPIKADRPNEGLGDGHHLCLVRSGRWMVLLLQRAGHLHPAMASYRFSTLVTADTAIESLVEAVAVAKPDCSRFTLQCDNGSQYAGKKFRKAASLLGIHLSFIRTHNAGAERPHRVVPRHAQARVHLATRFLKLSGGRGGHIRGIPGLQPLPGCTWRSSTSRRTSSLHHGRQNRNEGSGSV